MKSANEKRQQLGHLICQQYRKQEAFKEQEKQYRDERQTFESRIVEYLGGIGKKQVSVRVHDSLHGKDEDVIITAHMIESTKIVWYPEKLRERITKPIARQVIKKKYHIADMQGLSAYLQTCGVDPKEFAKYLSIEEEVDQDAVNRLGDLGKITPKNISGCYVVQCSKPYLKLTKKKEKQNDGDWEE